MIEERHRAPVKNNNDGFISDENSRNPTSYVGSKRSYEFKSKANHSKAFPQSFSRLQRYNSRNVSLYENATRKLGGPGNACIPPYLGCCCCVKADVNRQPEYYFRRNLLSISFLINKILKEIAKASWLRSFSNYISRIAAPIVSFAPRNTMKFWLGLLLLLDVSTTATTGQHSTIKGEIKDVDLCGDVLLETVCIFEVPDLTRRRRRRRRRLGGGGNQDNKVENVINSCKIRVDGDDVDSTVTAVDFCELKFDETVKGDDVKLLMFTSHVKLEDSHITGLIKLEAFEYDNQEQAMTTVKTFSITWSGC